MNQDFKTIPVIDHNGFQQPVKAYNINIPVDWQVTGGIFWDFANPCPAETLKTDWRAGNNDFLLQFLSAEAWQASNLGNHNPISGSLIMAITTVREYLEFFVSRYRPNALILGYGDRPDLITADTEAVINNHNRTYEALRSQGCQGNCEAQGGEMLIQYQENCSVYEEIIIASAMFHFTSSIANYLGMKAEMLMGHTCNCLVMRAPVGKLNLKLVETIRQSIVIEPDWKAGATQIHATTAQKAKSATIQQGQKQQQYFQNQMQTMQNNHQAFRDLMNRQAQRHNSHMAAMQDTANIRNQSWHDQQASQERMHQKFVRMTRGTALHWDPVRQQSVELPDTHKTAWQLNDYSNTKYQSDDLSFDPYRDLGVDGYRLYRQE